MSTRAGTDDDDVVEPSFEGLLEGGRGGTGAAGVPGEG